MKKKNKKLTFPGFQALLGNLLELCRIRILQANKPCYEAAPLNEMERPDSSDVQILSKLGFPDYVPIPLSAVTYPPALRIILCVSYIIT